jgi:hypothetical protein
MWYQLNYCIECLVSTFRKAFQQDLTPVSWRGWKHWLGGDGSTLLQASQIELVGHKLDIPAVDDPPFSTWHPMVYRVEHICVTFHYMQGFVSPLPNPQAGDHSLWAVCNYLFSIFTAALNIWWSCLSGTWRCHTMETNDTITMVLVAGSCEHCNELVGSIKGMEFTE